MTTDLAAATPRARWRVFLVFYLLALAIALTVAFVRAGLMPPAADGISPYKHLWDWLGARDLYINAPNILAYALDGNRWAFFVFAFAGAPTFAALIVVFATGGGRGLADLLRRLLPTGRGADGRRALLAYLILALAYAVGVAVYIHIGRISPDPDAAATTMRILGGSLWAGLPLLALAPFVDEGGLMEELGWRGFAMPLLQDLMSPLKAALLLGLLWWAWHLPREFASPPAAITGTYLFGQAQFAMICILMSVVIAWFVNATGGSVLPAMIIHGGSNAWSKAVGAGSYDALGFDLRLVVWVVGAALIIVLTQGRLGAPPRP